MIPEPYLILASSGVFSGMLAGFLGIGGGSFMVALLVALGYEPKQAIAASTLALVITALSGTVQNWRMGYLNPRQVLYIGLPALMAAQLGVYISEFLPSVLLLFTFGCMLLGNVYLFQESQQLQENPQSQTLSLSFPPTVSRIATGGTAGVLAGLFGIGGGIVLVPMQILLLNSQLAMAIQTSLGVVFITSVSAFCGHTLSGNVMVLEGMTIGIGGILGSQFSTRFLPQLPPGIIRKVFPTLLVLLAIYIFWQAWQTYTG